MKTLDDFTSNLKQNISLKRMKRSLVLPFLLLAGGCSQEKIPTIEYHGEPFHLARMSSNYLALSLADEKSIGDLTLRQKRITDIHLPTGKLVATDAFVFTEPEPFELPLPSGVFPVNLSIAHFSNDQRVAFATIRFRDSAPVAWTMLTLDGQDTSKLEKDEIFGYPVDSGTGCFIDASAAKVLNRKMSDNSEFYREMMAAMERTYVHTWSWLDMPFGKGNLVAFSSGLGDGAYATYAGFDADGEISVVVTDFSVVPLE